MGTVQIEVEVPHEDHVSEMQIVGPHPALGQWRAGHGIPARRRAGLCPPLPPASTSPHSLQRLGYRLLSWCGGCWGAFCWHLARMA
jgi:hypothetical protein